MIRGRRATRQRTRITTGGDATPALVATTYTLLVPSLTLTFTVPAAAATTVRVIAEPPGTCTSTDTG